METTTDKTKATIKQYVYEFKAKDRSLLELNSKSKIFLVINDLETSIAIESLFIGEIDFDDEDITGYSILQLITGGTNLKIDDNNILKITFIDKTTGREFYISKIRRPLMYDEDMDISSESRLRYIDLLLTTSLIPVNAAKADKQAEAEAAENERKRLEAEAENQRKQLEEEEKALAKANKEAEENLRKQAEADQKAREEAEKSLIPGGEHWEGQKEELIEKGFVEYVFDEYRFFYKKGEESGEIGFFILSPGNYEWIELYEEEITDEKEEYSFEDEKDNEVSVVFDKVAGKIKVG